MRRITALVFVFVAIATAALPSVASATHGGTHGDSAVRAM